MLDDETNEELDDIQAVISRGLEKIIEVLKKKYPDRTVNAGIALISVGATDADGNEVTSALKAGCGDYYSQFGMAKAWVVQEESSM